ncbi:hypothetical protein [Sphingomonas sp.]|jgi:hypothetical protein|uniref:hypothetical protein n=1 Tax=Sphingomonas sp. TaxID=28214 RepID=UPI002D7E5BE8|nr:hypothetical protein [Sphingomonas sp.]HEU0043234.1 hypothetical protein [Sphingomonas sp.]
MVDNVENLMLGHLKKFQATLESMQRDIRELKVRQSETHTAVLGLRRDQLSDAEVTAHVQTQMDRFGDRLDRIERRLDLTN